MKRALIIDDDATARADLKAHLLAHPTVAVVGEAATVKTARARLALPDYEIVFLDIELVGGSGFELVPAVNPGARIVFVTAHNEHAIRAFEVNALDYLLKPVVPARLALAVARMSELARLAPEIALRPDDLVHLDDGQHARLSPLEAIGAIEAQENYTLVHLVDGQRTLVRRTLKAWGAALPEDVFCRVHRTAIVNLRHVTGVRRVDSKSVLLEVAGMAGPVPVSRALGAEIERRIVGEVASLPGSINGG